MKTHFPHFSLFLGIRECILLHNNEKQVPDIYLISHPIVFFQVFNKQQISWGLHFLLWKKNTTL